MDEKTLEQKVEAHDKKINALEVQVQGQRISLIFVTLTLLMISVNYYRLSYKTKLIVDSVRLLTNIINVMVDLIK